MACHGPTSDLLPRDFPKWAEPAISGLLGIGKNDGASGFTTKVPGSKPKTEIPSTFLEAWQRFAGKWATCHATTPARGGSSFERL
jgi:hypothetical protein